METQKGLELAEAVSLKAKKFGAGQACVYILHQKKNEVNVRTGMIEKVQESAKTSLSLEVYLDGKYASVTTNDLRGKVLNELARNTVEMTKYLAADEYRVLPEAKYYPTETDASKLEIFDQSYAQLDAASRINMAKSVEEAARNESEQLISTTAYFTDSCTKRIILNSNGLRAWYETTLFSMGADATVKDGDSSRPEDYSWASSRYRSDLPKGETVGKDAVRRALSKIGHKKIETGKYTMVLENRAGYRMIDMLIRPMNGYSLQQKKSFLEGMIGKKIGSELLTIEDDPMIRRGLDSRIFDDEGLAAKRRIMINKGVLESYYIDNYYGKKLKMEPTSGSTSNLKIGCGIKSQSEIIKGIKKGIFITGFIGGNSNSTTGDFSIGIIGQYIEDGQIIKPVSSMNVSGNAKELWNQLIETGNDPYAYASYRCPSMVFENISFSGC